MSEIALAEQIDGLRATQHAYVTETPDIVIVSGLHADDAREVFQQSQALGWQVEAFDQADNEFGAAELIAATEPYRLQIQKPAAPEGVFKLLTNSGFEAALHRQDEDARVWHVARLTTRFETWGVCYAPWGDGAPFESAPDTKSPRHLVREYGQAGLVPNDIRPWLLVDPEGMPFDDLTFISWANIASKAVLTSLANEVSPENAELRFWGPPRLRVEAPGPLFAEEVGQEGLAHLQRAGRWVYESEREAEMRHGLFAMELARCGGGVSVADARIAPVIDSAYEGAKIAYQFGLADLSKDTLSALADLRKAVSDETAKLADNTRQLATSVAAALSLGVGLIVLRLSANLNTIVVVAAAAVLFLYVGAVISSGHQYIKLQDQLRKDWQKRLYRFLTESDFTEMVQKPSQKAASVFYTTACIGGIATLLILFAVGWVAFFGPSEAHQDTKPAQQNTAPIGASSYPP